MKIQLKKRPIKKGHAPHRSGSGKHDNRPKRIRTRQKVKENWIKDY